MLKRLGSLLSCLFVFFVFLENASATGKSPRKFRDSSSQFSSDEGKSSPLFDAEIEQSYKQIQPVLPLPAWKRQLNQKTEWIRSHSQFLSDHYDTNQVNPLLLSDLLVQASKLSFTNRHVLRLFTYEFTSFLQMQGDLVKLEGLEREKRRLQEQVGESQFELEQGSGCDECSLHSLQFCLTLNRVWTPCTCVGTLCLGLKQATIDVLFEKIHTHYFRRLEEHLSERLRKIDAPLSDMKIKLKERSLCRLQFLLIRNQLPALFQALTSLLRLDHPYDIYSLEANPEAKAYYQFMVDLISFLLDMTETDTQASLQSDLPGIGDDPFPLRIARE